MRSAGRLGFTLIELLTVIAIIAILAGMIMTVGPRMIERAKISSWSNTCNQLRTEMVGYFTKAHDTFPPGYGYRVFNAPDLPVNDPTRDGRTFNLAPYMSRLKLFGKADMYDSFSETYDSDHDGRISWLEFGPIGTKDPTDPSKFVFPQALYRMSQPNALAAEISEELAKGPRPMLYVPVRLEDAQKAVAYWTLVAAATTQGGLGLPEIGFYAERWRPTEQFPNNKVNPLSQIKQIPPPKYDDFVLISVGPQGSTGGLVTPPPNSRFIADLTAASVAEEDVYYYLALRAYYLATRDANENGLWDFDFRNRTRQKEAAPGSYSAFGQDLNLLPDGTNGGGPLIYLPNSNGLILK
jgi:prepilin-type N-terminal cleavage/methylation domain-containing protein